MASLLLTVLSTVLVARLRVKAWWTCSLLCRRSYVLHKKVHADAGYCMAALLPVQVEARTAVLTILRLVRQQYNGWSSELPRR